MKSLSVLLFASLFTVVFSGCKNCVECSQTSSDPTTEEKCGSKKEVRDFKQEYEDNCETWLALGVVDDCGCKDTKTSIL